MDTIVFVLNFIANLIQIFASFWQLYLGFIAGFFTCAFIITNDQQRKSLDEHFEENPVDDPIYQSVKKDRPGPNPFI